MVHPTVEDVKNLPSAKNRVRLVNPVTPHLLKINKPGRSGEEILAAAAEETMSETAEKPECNSS